MRGIDGNETCPTCFGIMRLISECDPRLDPESPDAHTPGDIHFHLEGEVVARLVGMLFGSIAASMRYARLRRIAGRWPRSLVCPFCGLILRRR